MNDAVGGGQGVQGDFEEEDSDGSEGGVFEEGIGERRFCGGEVVSEA